MVKFKKYTEKELNNFLEENTIEHVEGLSQLIDNEEVYLKFDDSTGVLTIKLQLKDEGDVSWN